MLFNRYCLCGVTCGQDSYCHPTRGSDRPFLTLILDIVAQIIGQFSYKKMKKVSCFKTMHMLKDQNMNRCVHRKYEKKQH